MDSTQNLYSSSYEIRKELQDWENEFWKISYFMAKAEKQM